MQVQLTDRQQHILWATVRHYIATAEPVGSKALVNEYQLGVSSATIRNIMGVLEKAGLLYQPHTSAGRVPSDSGYRIYVDRLITPSEALTKQVEQVLQQSLAQKDWTLDFLLQGAAQILATLSGCISLITMPQSSTAVLRHLQLVQVEQGRVMLIVVTDSYETHSAIINIPPAIAGQEIDVEVIDRELQIVSNFLNSQLRGKSLLELENLDWSQLDREFQHYSDLLTRSITEFAQLSRTPASTHITISGVSQVLRQPEFAEIQQVQTIMEMLESEQEQLWRLICAEPDREDSKKSKVTVRIGAENPLKPIRSCSLISSTYHRGSMSGSVGVLGPTRLNYESAIAVVSAAADYLSEAYIA
ncbi:MAG: heat-inducible transcriptional repressor HrcA [Calothrix sp. MO_192.B10]|nr:heat-inducible transcriptional repressor HrcA [Calothrix sp. MO_192.B10]